VNTTILCMGRSAHGGLLAAPLCFPAKGHAAKHACKRLVVSAVSAVSAAVRNSMCVHNPEPQRGAAGEDEQLF